MCHYNYKRKKKGACKRIKNISNPASLVNFYPISASHAKFQNPIPLALYKVEGWQGEGDRGGGECGLYESSVFLTCFFQFPSLPYCIHPHRIIYISMVKNYGLQYCIFFSHSSCFLPHYKSSFLPLFSHSP